MVEILVVLLIMGIIMAMIISTFRGTKKSTFSKTAQATAFSYQEAVDAYMADNGQRAPVVGSPAWPVADRGPVDPMFSNKPYMRQVPEHVSGGLVDFKTDREQVMRGAQAVIEYKIDPTNPALYTFKLWVIQGEANSGEPQLECVVTNRGQLEPSEKKCVS